MNRLKKPNHSKQKAAPKKVGPIFRWLSDIIDGSFLSGDGTSKNVPFALFICLLAGFYIANTYNAERTVRQNARLIKEVKDLRSEYITLKSELVFNSNPSQVAQKLAPEGIVEAKEPPQHLFLEKPTFKTKKP
jgi:cell division protein FtsL